MVRSRVAGAFVVGMLLVVASCAGDSASPHATSSSNDSVAATGDQAEAAAGLEAALAAFDPNDIDAAIAKVRDLDRQAELALAELEGMTAALGGPEATAKAFEEADTSVAALTKVLQEPVTLGFRRADATEPTIGMGLFGGALVVGLGTKGLVEGTNSGRTGSQQLAEGVTVTATADSAQLVMDATHEGGGLTTRLKTKIDVSPCPDANGQFEVSATIDTTSTVTGTSKSQTGTLTVKVTGQVDDNADLASDTTDMRFKRTGLGWGAFVDTSVRFNSDGTGSTKLEDFNWFTTTGDQMKENFQLTTFLGMLVRHWIIEPTVAGLQSGRCVTIATGVSPGTDGLAPSSTATITATARAKQDGAPAGGTISARLSAGESLVDPSGTPVPVDALFTYTAPDAAGTGGTVSLEARSKRGVGKLDVVFTTGGGYVASGESSGVTFSGAVGSISAPFTIDISFPGSESGSFTFDASTPEAGGVAVSAQGGGATVSGEGSYTITDNDDGTKTITADVNSCVDISGMCRSATHVILLTPAT